MGVADGLRKQLKERKQADKEESEKLAKEYTKRLDRKANRLYPSILKECINECERSVKDGHNRAHITFDGEAAQHAAWKVANELRKENFAVSYRFDTYGFRMDGEGNTLSEGTPYVAFDISW